VNDHTYGKYRLGDALSDFHNTNGLCSFQADLPGDVRCQKPATWHILVINPQNYEQTQCMTSCDEHYDIARGSAGIYFVQLHVHEPACSMPGTWWNGKKNICELEGLDDHYVRADAATPTNDTEEVASHGHLR
jgi:hypothetical protein